MKKILGVIAIVFVALVAYLLLWPVPIAPVAWQPPEAPGLTGQYAPNQRLAGIEQLARGVAAGPEDVAVDEQGRIYGAYADGRIRRFDASGNNGEVFADTGGRPLGLAWSPGDDLIVADAMKGLLRIRPDASVHRLATSAEGTPFGFVDDVDVGPDGTLYFSDASSKFGYHAVMADILEHGGNGRLLAYDPATDQARVLLDGLQFANGIAVGPQGRYVLVNETGAYRITRYWLKGERKGESEIFVNNLPGLPDGVSFNGDDTFWVAMYAPRNAQLDAMADKPWLRKIAYRLPQALQPTPAPLAFVLGFNLRGELVHNLQGHGPDVYSPITSVEQVGDQLYLGSLIAPAIGKLPVPSPGSP